MTKPNTYFQLRLSEDGMTVELTVRASSKERAIALYKGFEEILLKTQQMDLELLRQDKPET